MQALKPVTTTKKFATDRRKRCIETVTITKKWVIDKRKRYTEKIGNNRRNGPLIGRTGMKRRQKQIQRKEKIGPNCQTFDSLKSTNTETRDKPERRQDKQKEKTNTRQDKIPVWMANHLALRSTKEPKRRSKTQRINTHRMSPNTGCMLPTTRHRHKDKGYDNINMKTRRKCKEIESSRQKKRKTTGQDKTKIKARRKIQRRREKPRQDKEKDKGQDKTKIKARRKYKEKEKDQDEEQDKDKWLRQDKDKDKDNDKDKAVRQDKDKITREIQHTKKAKTREIQYGKTKFKTKPRRKCKDK
jgi:hypothetical protein